MNGVNNRTGKRLSGVAHLRQSVSDIPPRPSGAGFLSVTMAVICFRWWITHGMI
jgi:hypothetical protein